MFQQTFPVNTRKPRVAIDDVRGNLYVEGWDRSEIYVEGQGEAATLYQQDEVVLVAHVQGDLTIHVPAITRIIFPIFTGVSASQISQNVTIIKAGNVNLENIGSQAILRDIYGNVDLTRINEIVDATHIGGNLRGSQMPRLSVQNVGGNASLHAINEVKLDTVGGNFDVEYINSRIQCSFVGGNCQVRGCSDAQVNIGNVGGNLRCDSAAQAFSCSVGGNLHLHSNFPSTSQTNFQVGGNAHIDLPSQTNLTVRATVGGNASGPSGTYVRGSGFVNLVYGDGSASLGLNVGGNLRLSGCEPRAY